MGKRVWESDTASEEDEPTDYERVKASNISNRKSEEWDTASEEDRTPKKRHVARSASPANDRTFHEKPSCTKAIHATPPRPRIKSRIVGKKRVAHTRVPEPSVTPKSSPTRDVEPVTDLSLPEKRVPVERVFHHNGAKKYNLQDGVINLYAVQNSHAKGGYQVRVMQGGEFVGLIAAGDEVECRILLVVS